MISMEMYDYIRYSYFHLKMGIREISKNTGKSRQTIRKVIDGIEPGYRLSKVKPQPVLGEHIEIIKSWLEQDKKRPKKQRHTAKRIYERLMSEHDYKGSDSTVRKRVKKLKEELSLTQRECYIPSDPERREGAEMDWGEVYIDLRGGRTKVYMFCMRAKYSGKIFVKIYPAMLQECFFNGHIEAFAYYGGVFEKIVYDNLSSAVKKVLTGSSRIEQASFTTFRSHYNYAASFCNVCKGNEKGGVEGLVGYARRNYLTPIPACESIEKLNEYLMEKCMTRDLEKHQGEKLTIGEKFEIEKKNLLLLAPVPYNNYRLIETRADKYLTVRIGSNRYSVPEECLEKKVSIELGLYDVRIISSKRLVAEHKREFEKNKWILNPWHYMKILRRKSRALQSSRILTVIEEQWDGVVKNLMDIRIHKLGESDGSKDFLDTLIYFQNKNYSDMIAVIELAIERGTTCSESIVALYEMLIERSKKAEEISIKDLSPIANFSLPLPDVSKFDALMEVKNG